MHELVNAYKDTEFVKQIHLIESFKGAGFLSAVSLTIIAVALIVLCFAVCFINLRLLMLGWFPIALGFKVSYLHSLY